jgi:archaeal type IV pilus assembly protein PilA
MHEEAVSPVIGVLLMLTLTLIIAAIVNSYAGGLIETEQKAPSATLQITYSQINGMEIRHMSGDPIPTSTVKLMVRPSETFGRNASQFSSMVDRSYITNSKGESWANSITSLKPGDVNYITNNSATDYHLTHLQDDISDSKYSDYWFNQTENLGNTFFLEMYYKNTMISRNEVLIEG